MTSPEETPIVPPEGAQTSPDDQPDEKNQPTEVAPDAKEIARRRSKEDLASKRRRLHRSGGKR